MKNIVPNRKHFVLSREKNKRILEQTLDETGVDYIRGRNNLIIDDDDLKYISPFSKYFTPLNNCIVTGSNPSKYDSRFEEHHAFSTGSIFEVDLRGTNHQFKEYLKNNYSIER